MYAEHDAYAAVESALGPGATRGFNADGFKRCSPLRLLMPFIRGPIESASKAIFLDIDVVVLCDAERVRRVMHVCSSMDSADCSRDMFALIFTVSHGFSTAVCPVRSGTCLTSGRRSSGLAWLRSARQSPSETF
jgi:hypothetical protein